MSELVKHGLGLVMSSQGTAVTGEDPRQPSDSCLLLTSIFHVWGRGCIYGSLPWVAQVGTGWDHSICQAEQWNLYQPRGL